jgi:hypothetical protein
MPTGFTLFTREQGKQVVVGWRYEIKKGTVETALRSNEPFIKLADSVLVKFCGSEYITGNYDIVQTATQRLEDSYLYTEILLSVKKNLLPVNLPRGVEQGNDDVKKYSDALVSIHDRNILMRFTSAVQTFSGEYWTEVGKAMQSASMRADGNMVAKYFVELTQLHSFDELQDFLKKLNSAATNIGIFYVHHVKKRPEIKVAPTSILSLTPVNYDDKIPAYKRRLSKMLSSQIKVNETYFDLVRALLKKMGVKGVTSENHLSHDDYAGSKSGILLLTKKGTAHFNDNYKNLLDNLTDFGYNVYKIAKNSYVVGAKYREVVFIEFVISDWDANESEGSHIIIYRSRSKE